MSIERMELVNIAGLMKDLDEVLERCCQSQCFHIEAASHDMDDNNGFKALSEENPYTECLKRVYSVAQTVSYRPKGVDYSDVKMEETEDFERYVSELEKSFSEYNLKISELSKSVSMREQALIQLNHLKGLNVDFKKIFSCKNIGVRFGKLPADSYQKLVYYNDRPFVFVAFDNDKDYYWGVYFVPNAHKAVADDIFESLYFERVRIPDFVKGTAENAIEEITAELEREKRELEQAKQGIANLLAEKKSEIDKLFSKLKYLHDIFELRKNVSALKDKFYLVGFVPKKETKKFMSIFADMPDVAVLINPPELDSRLEPPIKLKNNWFAKPFEIFVEMYGLPSYNGFNPTMFVAITYTLIFGIMFGDLGQGIVIALAGLFIWKKKKNRFGQILTRIGCSSAFFGLVYGSVFGYEEALNPLYKLIGLQEKPIEVFEDTHTILIGAVSIGVVLIIVSILINIFINLKNKDYEKALFGNSGLAGLVFYTSTLVAMVSTFVFGHNLFKAPYVLGLIVLPLLVMFFRVPLAKLAHTKGHVEEGEGGIGEFITENFFELFEYLLSYITNTMSFLRIGGFVLSHAGLMLVVMVLAENAAAFAAPIVVVIGNIFVICLEGLIVGIQCLRLEYYEMFSRFYEGDGHAFKPVSVDYNSEIE
jgi:V/A-type H+-transporting ATPase subunit I